MKPCQEGYKCYYGDHYPDRVVCTLPKCMMKNMPGQPGMVFDQIRRKVMKRSSKKR